MSNRSYTTVAEVLARARELLDQRKFLKPPDLNGTGAPGNMTERLFGRDRNNSDTPDTRAGVEVKWHGIDGGALLKLSQKDEWNDEILFPLIANYGYTGANGLPSFRHPVWAHHVTNRGFTLVRADDDISVMNGGQEICRLSLNTLFNVLFSKHRRLLLMSGHFYKNDPAYLEYESGILYSELDYQALLVAIDAGHIRFDFNMTTYPNGTIRNHGTGIRLHVRHLPPLYRHRQAA